MNVLYNATSTRTGGGFTYAFGQVSGLAEQDGVEVTVLTAPWNHDLWVGTASTSVRLRPVRVPSVALRAAWEQAVLPVVARSFDVLLSPGNMGPLLCPVPNVVVLQNLNYAGVGRTIASNRPIRRRAKIRFSHLTMRRADRLVTVSDALAAEMAADDRLSDLPVTVVRSGAATGTVDGPTRAAGPVPWWRAEVGGASFALSVANDYPHKRLDDLADVAVRLAEEPDALPARVVLAGDISDSRREKMRERAGTEHGRLVFLGPVSDPGDLAWLYRNAAVTIATSALESWGLTLPEAGARGCPVVASDLPAHREVAGDHVRYFAPGDVDHLVEQLREVGKEPRPAPWFLDWTWSDHGRRMVEIMAELGAGAEPRR